MSLQVSIDKTYRASGQNVFLIAVKNGPTEPLKPYCSKFELVAMLGYPFLENISFLRISYFKTALGHLEMDKTLNRENNKISISCFLEDIS